MPNIRTLNQKKYSISKHRFREVYHFAMQYNEWKAEIIKLMGSKAFVLSDMPKAHSTVSPTEEAAVRIHDLYDKCRVIEETAYEVGDGLSEYLLKAVTNEGYTYNYLRMRHRIPCGRNVFYRIRREFYYQLSKKIK